NEQRHPHAREHHRRDIPGIAGLLKANSQAFGALLRAILAELSQNSARQWQQYTLAEWLLQFQLIQRHGPLGELAQTIADHIRLGWPHHADNNQRYNRKQYDG